MRRVIPTAATQWTIQARRAGAALLAAAAAVAAILAATTPVAAGAGEPAAAAHPDSAGWKKSLVAGLTFSQSAFSNWATGGTNSAAWAWSLRGTFEQVEPSFTWRHKGQLEYGLLKQEGQDLRKSVDLIELETLYTRKVDFFVNPFGSASLKTQFTTGRDFKVEPDANGVFPATSDFADPLYLAQSTGVGRILVPGQLTTRLGFTVRETLTDVFRNFAAETSVDTCTGNPNCERTKVETGLESITELARKLGETTSLSSKLGLFYSFEQPDELDVSWRSDLTIKALKILSVNFGVELLFDQDVLDKLQTKQALGIGVSYSLL